VRPNRNERIVIDRFEHLFEPEPLDLYFGMFDEFARIVAGGENPFEGTVLAKRWHDYPRR
jgi:hypothetical protein